MGRPNVVVAVSAAEAEQLRSIARSRSLPHSLAGEEDTPTSHAGSKTSGFRLEEVE